MSKLAEFNQTVKRLEDLTDLQTSWSVVNRARRAPETSAGIAGRVRITTSRDEDREAEEAANQIRTRLEAEYRARGEAERRQLLEQIALEIDQLRAGLPDLAAQAGMEMGVIANQLREESRQ